MMNLYQPTNRTCQQGFSIDAPKRKHKEIAQILDLNQPPKLSRHKLKDFEAVLRGEKKWVDLPLSKLDDPQFMLAAVQHDKNALKFASDRLKKNHEFMLAAMKWGDDVDINDVDVHLRGDAKFMLDALRIDPFAVKGALWHLYSDKDFMLAAVRQVQRQHGLIHAQFEVGQLVALARSNVKQDKDFMLAAARSSPWNLLHASKELTGDKDFMLAAARQDLWNLNFTSKELKEDKDFMFAAMQQNEGALQYAPSHLKKDKQFMLAAVQQYKEALRWASDDLKKDRQVVLAAVHKNGEALFYALKEFSNDEEVVLTAVKQNGNALRLLPWIFPLEENRYTKFLVELQVAAATANESPIDSLFVATIELVIKWLKKLLSEFENEDKETQKEICRELKDEWEPMISQLFYHYDKMSDADMTEEVEASVAKLRNIVLSVDENPCVIKEFEWFIPSLTDHYEKVLKERHLLLNKLTEPITDEMDTMRNGVNGANGANGAYV